MLSHKHLKVLLLSDVLLCDVWSNYFSVKNYEFRGCVHGLSISLILYVARLVWLLLFRVKEPLSLLYIAPRGLITVLLFFQLQTKSGEPYKQIQQVAEGKFDPAIILVVILVTCLVMTFSLISQRKAPLSNDVSIAGDASDSAEQV